MQIEIIFMFSIPSRPEIVHIKTSCGAVFSLYDKCMQTFKEDSEDKCADLFEQFSHCADSAMLTFGKSMFICLSLLLIALLTLQWLHLGKVCLFVFCCYYYTSLHQKSARDLRPGLAKSRSLIPNLT